MTCEEGLSFLFGGELADTEVTSYKYPNVYEGKTKPGLTSQLLKMSVALDYDPSKSNNVRLQLIEEHKKSLILRYEVIEHYNGVVEIGFEHFLIGLMWCGDSLIIEDWSVCKRIEP